jgi:hypothetical protein
MASENESGDAVQAFTELKASLPPHVVQKLDGSANQLIGQYQKHGEGGSVFLVFLACKIAAMVETGELL